MLQFLITQHGGVDWIVNSPEYLAVFLDDDGIGVCITFCWPCNGNIVGTRSNDYIIGSTILRVYTLDISKIQKGIAKLAIPLSTGNIQGLS